MRSRRPCATLPLCHSLQGFRPGKQSQEEFAKRIETLAGIFSQVVPDNPPSASTARSTNQVGSHRPASASCCGSRRRSPSEPGLSAHARVQRPLSAPTSGARALTRCAAPLPLPALSSASVRQEQPLSSSLSGSAHGPDGRHVAFLEEQPAGQRRPCFVLHPALPSETGSSIGVEDGSCTRWSRHISKSSMLVKRAVVPNLRYVPRPALVSPANQAPALASCDGQQVLAGDDSSNVIGDGLAEPSSKTVVQRRDMPEFRGQQRPGLQLRQRRSSEEQAVVEQQESPASPWGVLHSC